MSAASHDIGVRNAIEKFLKSTKLGDVANAASHDIGVSIAIENDQAGDVASVASSVQLCTVQKCLFIVG